MSEGGGFSEGLFWENQSWANLSNSDISGGGSGCGRDGEEKELGEGKDVIGISTEGDNNQVQAVAHVASKKRKGGGGGGAGKNGMTKGSASTTDKGKGKGKETGGGGDSDDHELHIWTERERRKKMRNMFSNLHALLPQLPPKADKSTIVDEAVSYIQNLQQTFQKLQRQKLERLQAAAANFNFDPLTLTTQNVALDSREAFLANHGSSSNLTVTTTTTPNNNPSSSLSTSFCAPVIFQTFTSPNAVVNVCGQEAQISVCSPKKPGLLSTICFIFEKYKIGVISAHVTSDGNRSMYMIQAHARGAPDQFLETFPAAEIFKQAVGEITFWINS